MIAGFPELLLDIGQAASGQPSERVVDSDPQSVPLFQTSDAFSVRVVPMLTALIVWIYALGGVLEHVR